MALICYAVVSNFSNVMQMEMSRLTNTTNVITKIETLIIIYTHVSNNILIVYPSC